MIPSIEPPHWAEVIPPIVAVIGGIALVAFTCFVVGWPT